MLKRIAPASVLILLLSCLLIPKINLQVNASHFGGNVIVSGEYKEKEVSVSFSMPQILKMGRYDWPKIENCSYTTKPGQPMLPVRNVVIKLPEGSRVTNVTVKAEKISLQGSFSILPAPSPVVAGSQIPAQTPEDPIIYKSNSPFPSEEYVYHEANGLDPEAGVRVKYVILNLFPLRFLPAEGKLMLAERISVIINYIEPPEHLTSLTGLKNLIITSPLLEAYALELGQWKNNTGFCSQVVTTTWIYSHYSGVDNQEKIRNCIKDFVAAYGIMYVTIFGDADQVPVRYVYVPDDYDTYTATDLYYADLDGTWDDNHDGLYADQKYDYVDGIPDVYIGRIPPSLVEYAQVAVDKIKQYQKRFDSSQEWTRRIVLAAGTGDNGDWFNPGGLGNATTALNEYISGVSHEANIVKLYESIGNLSNANMASEINRGALFVNFAGHGDPGTGLFPVGWLFYWILRGIMWNGFGIGDVQSLINGFKLPVVTTMSCSTARFDDTDCIGEWYVLEPNGGSIAYFGSTRVAWSYAGEWSPYGLMGEMDRRIYQNFYEGFTRLGEMWGQSITEYIENNIWNYSSASKYDAKTIMEFVLLGDPTLNIGQEWDASTVYLEGAQTKLQFGNSWFKVSDSSSWSGFVMRASASSSNGGCLYGPYITMGWDGVSLLGKPYIASFRLKVSSNAFVGTVAYIDVGYNAGPVLQSRQIKAREFASSNTWQDFKLTFIVPSSLIAGLEFRVVNWNSGLTDLYADYITVSRGWGDSTVYLEGAYNKPQIAYGTPVSWSRFVDASSWSGIVLKASASNASGSWLYGPYISSSLDGNNMRRKPYVASFRLKVLSNLQSNNIAYIDVSSSALGSVLQSKVIRANDFAAPNVWQDFNLTFIVPDLSVLGIEFRVENLNNGATDLYVDRIAVYRGWNTSTVYVESAYNKPKIAYGNPVSWSMLADTSSWSGIVLKAPTSSPSGSWLYGPYITETWDQMNIKGKPYTAIFTLKVTSRLPTNDVCYLDVYCGAGSTILKSVRVKASDFAASNVWQDFKLSFIVANPLTYGLEFRVMNLNGGITDLYIDKIALQKEWDTSTVYLESARNKPKIAYGTPVSWSELVDASSWSNIVLRASASNASGSSLYGPYIKTGLDGQSLLGKSLIAAFRLKVSSNLRTDDVAYIDVSCEQGKVILNSKKVRASDFASSDSWQDFQLTFTVPSSLTYGLEFRVVNLNNNVADLSVDIITIKAM